MGLCVSTVDSRTKELDNQIRDDYKKVAKQIKLLLLGAGESGKSTIAKQMKILHMNGFTKSELMSYTATIHSNAIEIIQTLLDACSEFGISLDDDHDEHAAAIDRVKSLSSTEPRLDPEIASDLKSIWSLPAIQKCFSQQQSELQIPSCALYIMSNLDRYASPSFVPNAEDVLRSRARTTGIHEIEFDVDNLHFRLVDVGGQRSERKKWAHCFEDVTAILFVVAMDSYDLRLYEDPTVNRIQEARKLFDDIINSKWFQSTAIVLFLNKSDLFAEKIKTVDLKVCFPDYKGGNDFKEASEFMQKKFKKFNRFPNRNIFTHTTCATDTEATRRVFNAVKETLVSGAMGKAGLGL